MNGAWVNLPNSMVTILYLVRGTTTWHTFAQFKTNSTGNYSRAYRFNFVDARRDERPRRARTVG